MQKFNEYHFTKHKFQCYVSYERREFHKEMCLLRFSAAVDLKWGQAQVERFNSNGSKSKFGRRSVQFKTAHVLACFIVYLCKGDDGGVGLPRWSIRISYSWAFYFPVQTVFRLLVQ